MSKCAHFTAQAKNNCFPYMHYSVVSRQVCVSVCVCACAHLPSHFSRICTVSPISSGRPCWTVPRKLASTATKRRQKKTPTWVFFFLFLFFCVWALLCRVKKKKKRSQDITHNAAEKKGEEVQSITCVGEIKSKLIKYLCFRTNRK